ncbi:MAG: hypothetical protein ACO3JL_03235 [Myxococcota bacterium]
MPSRPALGVARLERLLPADGEATHARLFCYDDGTMVVVPLGEVCSAPAGVWDKTPREDN